MKKDEAVNMLKAMGDELEWDELAELYEEFIGSPDDGITEFQMFSELCAEFGIME